MQRLLIAGFGDIARRALPQLARRFAVSRISRREGLDLDRPETLRHLEAADALLHLAPPPLHGDTDPRTTNLLATLGKGRILPARVVYVSTSGVYGDCNGELVSETHPARPQTDRAWRRADAEKRLREWGRRSGVSVSILRVPGIYAADRLPLARLEQGTPALQSEDDSYVNHVHADDLARLVIAALHHAYSGRMYNAVDDAPQKMGDYFDLVADRFGLPRPPRVARAEAARVIPETLLSFMNESRRLTNRRIKQELRFKLRYPTVHDGLAAALAARAAGRNS